MTDREMFEKILNELTEIKGNVVKIENKVEKIENKVEKIEDKVEKIGSKVEKIGSKVEKIESKVEKIESKVTEIEITLESETNRNIKLVAEGHLDLYRKLLESINTANTVDSKLEITSMRINKNESEINKLIHKIAVGN